MRILFRLSSSLIFLLMLQSNLHAQVKLPASFQQELAAAELEFYQPLERSFKKMRRQGNSIQNYQFAMRSRKGGLEIRYLILPAAEIPHIQYLTMASHIATNEGENAIAVHQIPVQQLKDRYHADWGATAYFRPKAAFSRKRHCKMLSLFASGKAQVFVFFLFNEPTEVLEQQLYSLTFKG